MKLMHVKFLLNVAVILSFESFVMGIESEPVDTRTTWQKIKDTVVPDSVKRILSSRRRAIEHPASDETYSRHNADDYVAQRHTQTSVDVKPNEGKPSPQEKPDVASKGWTQRFTDWFSGLFGKSTSDEQIAHDLVWSVAEKQLSSYEISEFKTNFAKLKPQKIGEILTQLTHDELNQSKNLTQEQTQETFKKNLGNFQKLMPDTIELFFNIEKASFEAIKTENMDYSAVEKEITEKDPNSDVQKALIEEFSKRVKQSKVIQMQLKQLNDLRQSIIANWDSLSRNIEQMQINLQKIQLIHLNIIGIVDTHNAQLSNFLSENSGEQGIDSDLLSSIQDSYKNFLKNFEDKIAEAVKNISKKCVPSQQIILMQDRHDFSSSINFVDLSRFSTAIDVYKGLKTSTDRENYLQKQALGIIENQKMSVPTMPFSRAELYARVYNSLLDYFKKNGVDESSLPQPIDVTNKPGLQNLYQALKIELDALPPKLESSLAKK